MNAQLEPYISAEEAGEFLSVSPRMVLYFARRGELPGHTIGSGLKRKKWRFLKSELDAFMKSRSNVSQPSVPAGKSI
jgi:excisionase family DNA binding protein